MCCLAGKVFGVASFELGFVDGRDLVAIKDPAYIVGGTARQARAFLAAHMAEPPLRSASQSTSTSNDREGRQGCNQRHGSAQPISASPQALEQHRPVQHHEQQPQPVPAETSSAELSGQGWRFGPAGAGEDGLEEEDRRHISLVASQAARAVTRPAILAVLEFAGEVAGQTT